MTQGLFNFVTRLKTFLFQSTENLSTGDSAGLIHTTDEGSTADTNVTQGDGSTAGQAGTSQSDSVELTTEDIVTSPADSAEQTGT